MQRSFSRLALAAAVAAATLFSSLSVSSAKTVKECDAEYAANKDAIKGSGQKKKGFRDGMQSRY